MSAHHDHAEGDREQGGFLGRVARAVRGVLAALVLYLAVPAVLVLVARVPVPRPLTVHSALTLRGLVDVLALVVWVAWVTEVAKLVGAVVDRVRHPDRAAATGLRDRLAVKIAALVLVLAPLVVARTGTSQAAPVRPSPAVVVALARAPTSTPTAPAPAPTMQTSVTVVAGDSLSVIALRLYGSESEWTAIWTANQGRVMADGRVFTNANLIYPGWQLALPVPVATAVPAPVPSPSVTTAPPTPAAIAPTPAPMVPPTTTVAPSAPHPPTSANRTTDPTIPVRLPSGSVVAGSFAAGVLAAVALGRLRRRHAYRYRPPEPGLDLTPDPVHPTLRHLATATEALQEPTGEAGSAGAPAMADDDPDHRERPDLIEVGVLDGDPIHLMLSELAGVAISGPGAEAVVAAWITALMVRAGPIAAEVVVTPATLDRLFGLAPGIGIEVLGLRVVESSDRVLRALEATVVARTRQLTDAEVTDVVAYRRANPWEPVPMVLAVLDRIPDEDAGRWAATLVAGPQLGFAAVVLDAHAATPAHFDLGADRVVVAASPDDVAARLVGVQLFGLTPQEAADVIAVLAEAEQRPDSTGADADGLVDGPVGEPHGADPVPVRWPDTDGVPGVDPPITVALFGPYEIRVGGTLVTTGLRTPAKELLAWLLLRPDGATVEAAVDALWPDTDPAQVHKQFWLGAANLRRLGATSEPATKVLAHTGAVYRPDADAIGCDLWQFQAALGAAARAGEDRVARDALRQAVNCYRGDLLSGTDYPWVEPVRQDLRRRALDAHLRLAELEARLGAPEAAEAVLQRAVELDRYSEEPYRRLMVLQGEDGRPDMVAETWRLLERRLAEIDVDPEPATLRIYRSLRRPGGVPVEDGIRVRGG